MSTMLIDGTGTGQRAKVDNHGRLYVSSVNIPHLAHHATYHKDAFISHYDTVLPDTSETPVALIVNNSDDRDLQIFNILASGDANFKMTAYLNSGYTSGGTETPIVNSNVGAGKQPVVTAYEGGSSGDLVVNTTNEQYIGAGFIAAYVPFGFQFDGSFIVPGGKSISLKVIGSASANVSLILTHTSHEVDTKL